MPATDRPTQEAPHVGEGKETLSCRTAASLSPSRPKAAFVPAANGLQSCRRERSAQSKRERNRCYGDNQIHANPQSGGRRSHGVTCPWRLAPNRGQSCQDGNPHVAGAVSIDRRAQALLPTVMAPSIANDFRHQSEEVPMCERARVSHNRRVPGKAQIAALLPALFLEGLHHQYCQGLSFRQGRDRSPAWRASKNSRFS